MAIACCGIPGTNSSSVRAKWANCEGRRTCTECTAAAPACVWLFTKQTCNVTKTPDDETTTTPAGNATTLAANATILAGNMTTTPESVTTPMTTTTTTAKATISMNSTADGDDSLMIFDVGSCPVFSVNYTARKRSETSLLHLIRLNVTQDPTGLVQTLFNRSQITCRLNERVFNGSMDGDGRILCTTTEEAEASREDGTHPDTANRTSSINYFSVAVNGVPLEFDNSDQHYLFEDYNSCHAKQQSNSECVNCFWDDDRYRYYCRWCPWNNICTGLNQNCDVRLLGNFSYTDAVADIPVRCPDAKIEYIKPEYGPWTGGTHMQIAVRNHKILSEKKLIKVTVGGSRCLLPTANKDDVITCAISPTNASRQDEGPVEVTYVSDTDDDSLPSFTLRSDEKFSFVDPEITSLRPTCGPMTGGTQLTVTGNFLNAGNELLVYVRKNISCAVTSRGQNEVTCVTGASDKPVKANVELKFDGYLTKKFPFFEYTGDPAVDDGQSFRGIASGGTRVPVRGRYLSCIENPLMFVSYNGIRYTGGCKVRNETYMECKAPKINRPPPRAVAGLPFGFQADFSKNILLLQLPSNDTRYQLHPDPVFTDYETSSVDSSGRTVVVVNGLRLNQGYHLAGDLSVRLQNATGVPCNVTSVEPARIVCRAPAVPIAAADWLIIVTLGNNMIYEVKRKPIVPVSRMRLTVFFSGITIISLIITIVVAVVYCLKIAMMSSTQQTEMQSLCEHLNNSTSNMEVAKDKETVGNKD